MNNSLPSLLPGQVKVWTVDIRSLDGHYDKLESALDSSELIRLDRFTNHQARLAFLAGRGSLRILLGRFFEIDPQQIQLSLSENGKPSLQGNIPPFFNVSHSGNIAVIAISNNMIGIDVEHCLRKVDIAAIMKRFFSEQEIRSWKQNSIPDPETSFFRGWTRKEAVLKATGEGIAGLRGVEVSFSPDTHQPLLKINNSSAASEEWNFLEFYPADHYIATLAVHLPSSEVKINQFKISE